MLGIARLRHANVAYYCQQLADDVDVWAPPDRTSTSPSAAGRWLGAGASQLGLRGDVDPEDLARVLAGRRPTDGRCLADRSRVLVTAYDLSFTAAKSVSVLNALGEGPVVGQVEAAQRAAVHGAMGYVAQRAVAVRRGAGEERRLLASHGVVAAAFEHATSRAQDPHLHTHVVVANLVHAEDGRWGAIDGRGLFAHAEAAGRLYDAHLRHELTERLGVAWGAAGSGGYELAGIGPMVRAAFSTRQADIRLELAVAGRSSSRAARVAWARTRPDKVVNHAEDRRARWRHRADELGFGPEQRAGLLGRARNAERALDEQRFAASLFGRARTRHFRRDVVGAWAHAVSPGVPVAAVEAAVDHWLGPEATRGVGERPVPDGRLCPAPHLVRALGPRPAGGSALGRWSEGASVVEEYRRRWQVMDTVEPLGTRDGPPLSSFSTGRLADHLATARRVAEVRRDLGRSLERGLDRRELELGRA